MASSPTDPGLGDFEKLPAELRLQVYRHSLPDDFKQTYVIDPKTGVANRFSRSSPLPVLFIASSRTLSEALQGAMIGRTCTIWIEEKSIMTNFPISLPVAVNDEKVTYPEYLRGGNVRIPLCQKLRISIQLPSPRKVDDFLRIRRNVLTTVNVLNASRDKQLPRLEVKLWLDWLDSTKGGSNCVWNDFAMLMGPLAWLKQPCISAVVQRNSGGKSLEQRSEHQCQLIENFLHGSADAIKEFWYQQSMLDIKLALSPYTTTLFKDKNFSKLNSVQAADIWGRLESVRAWFEHFGEKGPSWLGDVERMIQQGEVPEPDARNLLSGVLNGKLWWELDRWAAGLTTTFSPF